MLSTHKILVLYLVWRVVSVSASRAPHLKNVFGTLLIWGKWANKYFRMPWNTNNNAFFIVTVNHYFMYVQSDKDIINCSPLKIICQSCVCYILIPWSCLFHPSTCFQFILSFSGSFSTNHRNQSLFYFFGVLSTQIMKQVTNCMFAHPEHI